ncbi:hypothetical protein EDB84DRAFT_1560842 [Lactarius hengduanensis]|nr:hypothetical protein EDB84DRAFT_1560842 [Lactarius hengduanensis]
MSAPTPTPTPTLTYSRKASRRRLRDENLPFVRPTRQHKRPRESTDEHPIASSSKDPREPEGLRLPSPHEHPPPSPPLDPPATHSFRTPIKSTASLPGSSPLTPLSASPLKRTSTHPMDHCVHSDQVSGRVSRDSARSLHSKANKPVAKRMLGRTRSTLSAVDGPTGSASLESMASNSLNASAGLPLSPHHIPDLGSAGSQTPTITGEQFQSNIGTSTAPLQRSNVRTYTGRSRSFLVELPTEGNLHGAIDGDDLGLETRESYKDLRMRWGVDDSEDDPRLAVSTRSSPEPENGRKGKGRAKDRPKPKALLPPNMMNDLKSITELRSKGESRRFMDEVGYLFEGMDQNVGVRVRRGSALELVTKLCDPDFARRARVTDFRSRAWDALRASGAGNGDKVLDAILVLFAALVLQTSHEVTELTQKADFVPVLWNVLATSSGADSLELLGNGANDGELKKLESARPRSSPSVIVNKSGLVADEEYLSLCQLASRTLASLPPSVHRPSQLAPLRQTLIVGLSFLSPRLSGYASGLPLLPNSSDLAPSSGVPQFNHIADSLDIFDSLLLGRWSSDEEPPPLYHDVINGNEQDDLAEGLVNALCRVQHLASEQ